MKLIKVLALAMLGAAWLGTTASAQSTNTTSTEIGTLESQTNVLIIKGFSTGDTVSLGGGILAVRLKESYSPGDGKRLQALVLDFVQGGLHQRAVVDYAEIDSLLYALDYIRTATYDVTGLSGFEATYQTRDGFRVIGLGSHRQSSVQTFVQFDDCQRILLDSDQMSQLRGAIAQGRNSLDGLRSRK